MNIHTLTLLRHTFDPNFRLNCSKNSCYTLLLHKSQDNNPDTIQFILFNSSKKKWSDDGNNNNNGGGGNVNC